MHHTARMAQNIRVRAELIGHFEACMTEIYLRIDARMADYIRTHPYACNVVLLLVRGGT